MEAKAANQVSQATPAKPLELPKPQPAKKQKQADAENKVKRPMSAFMLYCTSRRPLLKREDPSMVLHELIEYRHRVGGGLKEDWVGVESDVHRPQEGKWPTIL